MLRLNPVSSANWAAGFETFTGRQVATPTQKDREMWISAEESKDVLKAQGKSILSGNSHTSCPAQRSQQLSLNRRYLSCRHRAPMLLVLHEVMERDSTAACLRHFCPRGRTNGVAVVL